MKYDRYERDARAFGWPPAFFNVDDRARGTARLCVRRDVRAGADPDRLPQTTSRADSSRKRFFRAWRCQRGLSIAVIATVAVAAVAVATLLL
jgi:hypothetical protein